MERDFVLKQFRTGKANILVATDVAARGLDVDGIRHVINYDYPGSSEVSSIIFARKRAVEINFEIYSLE